MRALWLLIFLPLWSDTVSVDGPPFEPQEALKTIKVPDGIRVDLVAAEPLVADPVAMDIDEYGRIWVAEMPGYPLDVGGSGRIKILHDTDQDGRPDSATVFADGLRLPTGIMRWKDGVLVTDPPDIFYLPDNDGDSRADSHIVVLTGFALSNPQHNANSPIYGLTNWIYVANNSTIWWTEKYADPFGDQGEQVYFPDNPEGDRLPRNAADRNARFRPDTYELELLGGRSQFGHTFDAWGRHFLVNNSQHHLVEALASQYLERRPELPIQTTIHRTSDHGDAAEVYPITIDPLHQLLTDRGVFTSACALTWQLGGLLPAPFDSSITLVAEPVHNLVHIDRIVPDGPVFRSERVLEKREFIASTDSWFRPVNFTIGPDGGIYVVDYYREIIEHPEWMDDSLAATGDLHQGTDRGRIYRIVPEDTPELNWHGKLSLANATVDELVDRLASDNIWWRRNAQRILVSRNRQDAVAPLSKMAASSTSALGRLHALWTLNGLGALTTSQITSALDDSHPGVRENAIRLTELVLSENPELGQSLLAMTEDTNVRVRYQLLNTLGFVPGSDAAKLRLLAQNIESEWFQTAALLALDVSTHDLMQTVLNELAAPEHVIDRFVLRLARILARTNGLVPALTNDGPALGSRLAGAAEGLQQRQNRIAISRELSEHLVELALSPDDELGNAAVALLEAVILPEPESLEQAQLIATDINQTVDARVRAVRILSLMPNNIGILPALLDSSYPVEVQLASVEALGAQSGTGPAQLLLQSWPNLWPRSRNRALDQFSTQDRANLLVTALEEGVILTEEISWYQRVRLMRDTEEPVRSRARAILKLEDAAPGELAIPGGPGNNDRGQVLFENLCAQCHMAGEVGTGAIGPNLATVQHWPRHVLLAELQNPSQRIASGYESWRLTRTNGSIIEGIIASETSSAITMRSLTETVVVPRQDVKELTAMPGSFMPPGLNMALEPNDLRDLLSFLRQELPQQ
ncbi:MAG: dehydrogenase [Rhodothermaceae bacterium]|nr:dehydrogenase [Rhodothermaceae bacterium]MXX58510.1 dehydrogenase [Rhodothermaceae bacterium]MYD19159.1 dehydrogenase [Rhodothermaceae bacterium]MYD56099.1 dehydrogenase [Rhodothermaceae bacterium]MYJ55261.1 dehydrogenase [Rhodothermaceae bacterium]